MNGYYAEILSVAPKQCNTEVYLNTSKWDKAEEEKNAVEIYWFCNENKKLWIPFQ